ncbi:MAG: penicillin-insensitive murein endopeptidase [Thermoleophilaceae bacterium]
MKRSIRIAAAALAVAFSLALAACGWRELEARLDEKVPPPAAPAQAAPERPRIEWKRSVAVGSPAAGRLVRGVRLPAEGKHFFTWDPVKRRSHNRAWRRWGTNRLVRLVLRIAREYRAAHPGATRMSVGDLSRPRGGDFGPQFGYIGHASHQNGLDVDVYYPRADERERAPRDATQIDRRLSQDLVDRFVEAGAVTVYVGPNTGLTGPPAVVPLVNHDNHLHVRIAP